MTSWIVSQLKAQFDKIFRFEIPGIPCDEWNSIFRFLELTRSRSMVIKFQVSRENTKSNGGLFYLSGCSIDDAEVKINHVLCEGDIINFYRKNLKGVSD